MGKNSILVVEDMELYKELLNHEMYKEYDFIEVSKVKKAMNYINKNRDTIAIIILDLKISKEDGFFFLTSLEKEDGLTKIPVMIVTMDRSNEAFSLRHGAWDFIDKPVDLEVLKARMDAIVERKSTIDMLMKRKELYAEQLSYMTVYDELTGIYNLKTFFAKAKTIMVSNPNIKYACMVFDINRFKLVNELFGHGVGNQLLCHIATCLATNLREERGEVCGRMHADTFVALFPFDKQKIEHLVMESEGCLAKFGVFIELVASFGIYVVNDSSLSIDLVCDRAMMARSAIKGNYIKRFAYYDEALHNQLLWEQEITNEMVHALNSKQFQIYLQPKCSLRSGEILGAEALVRWLHPEKGVISPNEFISIFEKNGFIFKMDEYVWEQTCELIKKWLTQYKHVLPVSVNVSKQNLYHPEFSDILLGIIAKYDIPPTLLELELSETVYTDDSEHLVQTMAKLQNAGLRIIMEDFGSGFSSLKMLHEAGIDCLKIDLRDVVDKTMNGKGEIVLESIITLTKKLNLPVVIEGVETKEEVDFLRTIGCDVAQGYYYSRPVLISEFEKRAFRFD